MKKIYLLLCFLIVVISGSNSANYTVTKTTDDLSTGTLRSAIISSNSAGGSNTITISTTGTITLTSAFPVITSQLSIDCTNASGITISGNNLYRIFEVNLASGTVTFKNLNILNGKGDGGGGGIFAITSATGFVSCENCSFTGCSAVGSQAFGGAIQSSADLNLLNCTFTSNTSVDGGGAIEILDPLAVLTMNHCTVYQNTTMGNNIAGGIDVYLGTINISNSIVGNNLNGVNIAESDISKDVTNTNTHLSNYNVYTTAPFSGANDLVNKTVNEIGLSALSANGGKVKTMRIGLASVARDAGTGTVATDAREYSREGIVDIGAFESISPTAITNAATSITTTSAVLNGQFDTKGYTLSAAEFEYGYSSGNYTQTVSATVSGGVNTSYSLTNQSPGAVVYYRQVITVDGFKFYGLEGTAALSVTTGIDEQKSMPKLTYNAVDKQIVVNGQFDYVELFDATGKFIQKSNSKTIAVNSKGLIIVRLYTEGKQFTQKIAL